MAKAYVPMAGGIVGMVHTPGAYLLTQGRSLAPLQRQGSVSHSGFPSTPAGHIMGAGSGPEIGVGPDLGYPATLTPGITVNPALRV